MSNTRTFARIALAAVLAAPLSAPLAAPALAPRTYLDIGSPDFHPLPIAIARFKAEPEVQSQASEMAQVLRDDLLLSGLFDLLDPKSFLADPAEGMAAPTIRFTRWADIGAEGLVKVAVRRAAADVSAELHLYEVRAGKEVLFQVHTEKPASARGLAHAFADDIVRYYTHEPGIFRTRIAAIRKGKTISELVLFDVDGGGAEVALRDSSLVMMPHWKPDGSALLFTGFRSGRAALWTIPIANRTPHSVLSLGELSSGGVYSPDGKHIAFTASTDGNADVWVASADGTNPRRITTDPALDTSPSWSPDGKRIAFVSNRSGSPQIFVMNADGSEQRRLTFQGTYNQTPRWSPRGDLIAFTARDERKVFDVFTVAVNGGKIQRVTQDQGLTNEEPSWAPNGRLLVFTSDRSGKPQLVISTPTGDHQKVITSDAGELATPTWGPLGQ